MGTRARVGLRLELDNGVESIYTHWDGYPSHHGPLLLDCWNTRTLVAELVALGDLSALGREAGQQHDFDAPYDDPTSRDWCKAYGRDRGEDGVEADSHPLDSWPDSGHEHEYLFTPGEGWTWRERKYDPGTVGGNYRSWWTEWQPLTPELCADDADPISDDGRAGGALSTA
jgi:hypothetical protein